MIDTDKRGFTLIELMIVVAVVGILAAIAYPSYVDSVRKARRSDGTAALMNAAQRMEVYYAKNATYTSTPADANIPTTSEEGYYTINISSATTSGYTLRATPVGDQLYDKIKGFQLTSTGAKTFTLDGFDWTTNTGWDY